MKKKLLTILENLFLVFAIILFVFVMAQKYVFKGQGLFGYQSFVIITNSMAPDILVGDVIITKKVDVKNIKIGDVVTYLGEEADFKNKVITHKVKNIIIKDGEYIFYTKGNATTAVDPAIRFDQIYGKMIYKSLFLGFLSKIIRSKMGFILMIMVPLTAILVYQVFNLKKEIKNPTIEEPKKVKVKKDKKKLFKKKNKVKEEDLDDTIEVLTLDDEDEDEIEIL